MKTKIFFIFLIFIFIATAGLTCGKPTVPAQYKPITLNYWRVWDDQDTFNDVIAAYQVIHPNITINYRRLRYEEYKKELLEAFAQDRGPDIFSIQNTWVGEYKPLITPLPASITLPYPRVTGTIKKETIIELKTTASLTLRQLRNNFVDVVYKDVVIPTEVSKDQFEDKIYGLPLSVDSLALFYNRDLLNNAGIPQPPTTWNQFQEQVVKITKLDTKGNLLLSGGAIGTSGNVERSTDILSILMMQNGAEMMTDSSVTFHRIPPDQPERPMPPGQEALIFYTDFANPSKEVYCWNSTMEDSLEAFIAGKTAFFFGYSYHIPEIRARAPKLNYGITKLPQIEGNREINYANYWVEVVSKKTKNINEAWDFIQYITAVENVPKHLEKAKKPTALRGLINSQLENLDLSVFASQILTSDSWYRGKDADAAEAIFKEMIDTVVSGLMTADKAINLAAGKVAQTIR